MRTRKPSLRGMLWMGAVTLVLSAGAALASSGGFALNWWTVDGGGGASTGGAYSLSGTIGQPDAGGALTGGPYSLEGGYWVGEAADLPSPSFSLYLPSMPR